jgi:MerR family redox-sensitive transcriptional activator SoxR
MSTVAQILSVGELSARSGVSVSALHFYETKGLIFSFRTSGNQRRFNRAMLRRVGLIQFGQALGITLAEIHSAFNKLAARSAAHRKRAGANDKAVARDAGRPHQCAKTVERQVG